MSILVLQHFEEYWAEGLSKNGTDFSNELNKVLDFVNNQDDLEEVIITRFENYQLGDEHQKLEKLCQKKNIALKCFEYMYAWEKQEIELDGFDQYPQDQFNKTWCQGTREYHSENDVIEIAEWMHLLKDYKVFLGGSFEGECIADIQAAFDAIKIDYQNVDGLIVGSVENYAWRGLSAENLDCKINDFFNNVQTDFENKCEELNIPEDMDMLNLHAPSFAIKFQNKIKKFYAENFLMAELYDLNMYCDHENIQDFIDFECDEDFDDSEMIDDNSFDEIEIVNSNKKSTYKLKI